MPSGSEVLDFLTQSILENEKRKKKNLYGDRLLASPTKLPVAGEEKPKASDILMLLASGIMNPSGTALGLAEGALRPESSIFDNEIPLPEGGYAYPEKLDSVVPKLTKTQRKAIMALQKYPTRESYLAKDSIYKGKHRKPWGKNIDKTEDTLTPEFTDPGKVQIVSTPTRQLNSMYHNGIPIAEISTLGPTSGEINVSQMAESARGTGLGKALYKYLAQQGKNIYETKDTSKDAAHARYSAIKELANRDFVKTKPINIKFPSDLENITARPNPEGAKISGKTHNLSTKKFTVPTSSDAQINYRNFRTAAPTTIQEGLLNELTDRTQRKANWLMGLHSALPTRLSNRGIDINDPMSTALMEVYDTLMAKETQARRASGRLHSAAMGYEPALQSDIDFGRRTPQFTRRQDRLRIDPGTGNEPTLSLKDQLMQFLNDYYQRAKIPKDERYSYEDLF